jgi:transcription elongation factor Elf1
MKFEESSGISSAKGEQKDKAVISSEYYTNEIKPSYLCSFCNQTLVRLTDAGQNNTSWFCRNCNIEFDPESENVRRESKLFVPDRSIQPAVTSIQTNMADEVEIRHSVPKRGGFAELEKKDKELSHDRKRMN